MSRSRSIWPVIFVSIVSVSALVGAQVIVRAPPPRDVPHPEPEGRQIPIGTSSISGTVFAADSNLSVAGARVTISGTASCIGGASDAQFWLTRAAMTNALGQFAFPRLPAGVFWVSISSFQNQFLETNYGERRSGGRGQSIRLADGQQIALKVPLLRGAAITGIVSGPDGEPQRNVQVRALRYDTSGGFKRLQSAGYARTDDRGAYRMVGLRPGDYIVAATPNPTDFYRSQTIAETDFVEGAIRSAPVTRSRTTGMPAMIVIPYTPRLAPETSTSYLPTYSPGSATPSDGTPVTVAGGEERNSVDIRVLLIPAGIIKGVVSTPLDPSVRVQLWLIGDDPLGDYVQGNMSQANSDGTFVFRAVSPGTYTVFAQTIQGPQAIPQTEPPVLTEAQKKWGQSRVTVAGEGVTSTAVQLQAYRSISGIVVFDMQRPPDLTQYAVTVMANPAASPQQMYFPNGTSHTRVGADGRFTISGVPPGRYVLELSEDSLKSSMVSGQDTRDFPIEFTGDRDVTNAVLTVTDRVAELNGTLTDSAGKPALDYTIVVATTDSRFWRPGSRRVSMTQPDPEGRFEFDSLPAGSYFISVVVDPEPGAMYDPEFLRTIARTSIPVTIPETGKVIQNLRVK